MIQAIYTNCTPVLLHQLNTLTYFIVALFGRKGNTLGSLCYSLRSSVCGPSRERHFGYTFVMMPKSVGQSQICWGLYHLLTFLLFWQRIRGLHECSSEHTSSSIIEVAVLVVITITHWLLIIFWESKIKYNELVFEKQMYYSRLNSPLSFCHNDNNDDKGDNNSTRHWSNDSHRCVHAGWGCSFSRIIVVESRSNWSGHNNQ